ncbi:MAG: hypothetical protein ACREO5_00730 [Candidatus Binatia bacterium]
MAVAVPLVQDDRFWPDSPQYLPRCREVESFLDQRALVIGYTVVPDLKIAVEAPRGARRRRKWFLVKGIRPVRRAELKSTPWWHRESRSSKKGKCERTKLALVHDSDGRVELQAKRSRITVPLRRDLSEVAFEEASELPFDTATTVIGYGVGIPDVSVEESPVDGAAVAVVDVREPKVEIVADVVELDDGQIAALMWEGDIYLPALLPVGCSAEDEEPIDRRMELARLDSIARPDAHWE